jgi:F-type H+-transporting ATPase subunit b
MRRNLGTVVGLAALALALVAPGTAMAATPPEGSSGQPPPAEPGGAPGAQPAPQGGQPAPEGGGAQEGGGGGGEEGGSEGNFLVSPNLGIMIWTLIAFGLTLLILRRFAFPRIAEALDRRRKAIEDSIDAAERTRQEADQLLQEYRERLREAREQAEDIVARARKASDRVQDEAKASAKQTREEMMEHTRREIEAETRRALDEIRKEVANLTISATEKVTRRALDDEDHRRLIDEALAEVDFAALAPEGGDGASGNGAAERSREGERAGGGGDR